MAVVPVDAKYIGELKAMDEAAYGPGVYDWWHANERVTIMMYERAQGFLSYRLKVCALEIEKLVVAENMRRLGIGSEMLHWVIRRALFRKLHVMRCTLPLSNVRGALFLAHHGFESRLGAHDFIHFERPVVLR